MERDAVTFFDTDLPALLSWQFESADARRIECPVMHIGGTESGRWFAEVRDTVLDWFPQADDMVIDGANHSLAVTHSRQIAHALVSFLEPSPDTASLRPNRPSPFEASADVPRQLGEHVPHHRRGTSWWCWGLTYQVSRASSRSA
jgi:hypothetical protein